MEWFKPHGPIPAPPAIFGQYEMARTSLPGAALDPSAAFQDTTSKASKVEITGDPGKYNPWEYDDRARLGGHSRKQRPFDSTAFRDLSMKCEHPLEPVACRDDPRQ